MTDRLEPAPFFHAETTAPPGTRAHWSHAPDGVRLRVGWYGAGPRGTVLCFPGRTEYLEKYGPTAAHFAAAGLGMVAVDWRGQGLAERLLPDPELGHVERFADYQHDVAALLAFAEAKAMPRPWYLLGHSMGGAIGLRALLDGLDVQAAAFTAPMWGLTISPVLRQLARWLPQVAQHLGGALWMVPGSGRRPYILTADPEDNRLTTDPDTFRWFRGHLHSHPELALAGPTMRWLHEANREFDAFAASGPPAQPCRVWLGSRERIVSPHHVRDRARAWATLDMVEVAGG